ncbi:hypothetical protein GQ44DRAFT_727245 [Phaeosphaeriaceae sp. PMI808]|nr:hypothetical protein GQ44DRAFT_727245 [Phaeosphaeriaceae sp. PMI808]
MRHIPVVATKNFGSLAPIHGCILWHRVLAQHVWLGPDPGRAKGVGNNYSTGLVDAWRNPSLHLSHDALMMPSCPTPIQTHTSITSGIILTPHSNPEVHPTEAFNRDLPASTSYTLHTRALAEPAEPSVMP